MGPPLCVVPFADTHNVAALHAYEVPVGEPSGWNAMALPVLSKPMNFPVTVWG
jgi:hypothetical protein